MGQPVLDAERVRRTPDPFASITTTDTTTVPSGWQNADVSIPFSGANTSGYEWKLSCGGAVQTTDPATFTVQRHLHLHPPRRSSPAPVSPTAWVDDTVQIDKTLPVDSTTDPVQRGARAPSACRSPSPTTSRRARRVATATRSIRGRPATRPSAEPARRRCTRPPSTPRGNRSATTTHAVKVDNTLPVDTTVTPAGWVQDVAHITLSGTDAGDQSGVATLYYQLDGGPSTPANNGDVLDITANGTHTLRTRVVDNAGNDSGWTTAHRARSTPPARWTRPPARPSAGTTTAPSVERQHRRDRRLRLGRDPHRVADPRGRALRRRRRRRPRARHRHRRGHPHAAGPLHGLDEPRDAVARRTRSRSTRRSRSTAPPPRAPGSRRPP